MTEPSKPLTFQQTNCPKCGHRFAAEVFGVSAESGEPPTLNIQRFVIDGYPKRVVYLNDAEAYASACVSRALAQQKATIERLQKKLVICHDLLSEWGILFNWREWRTDTKHVSDSRVSELVHKTCGREYDEEVDDSSLTKNDYLVVAAELRIKLAAAESRIAELEQRISEYIRLAALKRGSSERREK